MKKIFTTLCIVFIGIQSVFSISFTFSNLHWKGVFDCDNDSYARMKTLQVTITPSDYVQGYNSKNYKVTLEKRKKGFATSWKESSTVWHTFVSGELFDLEYKSLNFEVTVGTQEERVEYDFRIRIFDLDDNLEWTYDQNDNALLDDQKFEYASEDGVCYNTQPCETTLTNLYSGSYTSSSAYIEWEEIDGVLKYQFRYKEKDNSIWSSLMIENVGYTIPDLKCNTNYEYQIRTYCGGSNYSEWSSSHYFKTSECPCNIPENIEYSKANDDYYRLDWNPVVGAEGYIVRYYEDNAIVEEEQVNNNYYGLKTKCGSNYEFIIRTNCGNNNLSDWSDAFFFSTLKCPTELNSISIDGPTSVYENSSANYTCSAFYSDNTTEDVTDNTSWSSSCGTINSNGVLTTGSVSSDKNCTVTASFGGESISYNITIKYKEASLTSISIDGPNSVYENSSATYTCTAFYSDNTSEDVTDNTSWNSTYGTINSNGVLTTGSVSSDRNCTITASYGGESVPYNITIKNKEASLISISIDGPTSVYENSSANYTCTAFYSDNTTEDVTDNTSWSSSYATINSSGTLTTSSVNSNQSCTITAIYEGKSDTRIVTIKDISNNYLNVALSANGGVASAISECTYNGISFPAYLSNDGDNRSTWASNWSMPAWLKIKFSESYLIKEVGVFWCDGSHNQDYSISLSSDGNYWVTVVPERSSNTTAGYTDGNYHGSTNESHEVFEITPMNAQYIKIDITKTSAPSDYPLQATVQELEAYVQETKTVTSIVINGTNSVNENSSAKYTCTAYYSDNTSDDVTDNTSWNSTYGTINSNGILTTGSVSSNRNCTITASYGGESVSYNVTIKNKEASLTSISIDGPTSVYENSSANYTCTAYYSDNTSDDVTDNTSWNSTYGTINSSGVLTTGSVNSDRNCTITASYGGESVSHTLNIKNNNNNNNNNNNDDALVWKDGFENYSSEYFPSSWGVNQNLMNDNQYYIDNNVKRDGSNSLKLFGILGGCEEASAIHSISTTPPYFISLDIKNGTEQLSGCEPDRIYIALQKGTSFLDTKRTLINFKNDGNIYARGTVLLDSYSAGSWINLKMKYELPAANMVKITYWINNEEATSVYSPAKEDEYELDNLQLSVKEGSGWFDNVKIYKALSTGFDNHDYESLIRIYPNPVNNVFTVSVSDPLLINSSIKVINSLGKIIKEVRLDSYDKRIDTSNLPSGIYLVQIKSDNFIYNKKITK